MLVRKRAGLTAGGNGCEGDMAQCDDSTRQDGRAGWLLQCSRVEGFGAEELLERNCSGEAIVLSGGSSVHAAAQ